MKRYECMSGYVIAEADAYQIGDYVEGIGEVQYITEVEDEEDDG